MREVHVGLVVMVLGEGRDEDGVKCSWRDKQGQTMKSMKVLFRDLFKYSLEALLPTKVKRGLLH